MGGLLSVAVIVAATLIKHFVNRESTKQSMVRTILEFPVDVVLFAGTIAFAVQILPEGRDRETSLTFALSYIIAAFIATALWRCTDRRFLAGSSWGYLAIGNIVFSMVLLQLAVAWQP